MTEKKLKDYLEIHYEIASQVSLLNPEHFLTENYQIYLEKGRSGLYEIAKKLTDEFHKIHKNTLWGKDENTLFCDILEKFIDENL